MIMTLAIANYRSLLKLTIPLGQLTVITGPNGTGKSNLYRALRLLAETGQGGVINALAREGGLASTLWAGPETLSRSMQTGLVPVQGAVRQKRVRLKLGFASDDFGYSISFGLPKPSNSAFSLDPEIKRECIWSGESYRPARALVDRNGASVKIRNGRQWEVVASNIPTFDSIFTHLADPRRTPEIFQLREQIASWRFYDYFRTDADAPARQPQLGTRTPVLHHDGHDLAAALQTICEIGDRHALNEAVDDAFPGASVSVQTHDNGRFSLEFYQPGLLRPLSGAELSDGTLRYLLLIAALLTPRPPPLMVLNEPETSLHPDLLPALARLIIQASKQTQVWVVSHAGRLLNALQQAEFCYAVALEKELGQTRVQGLKVLDEPSWHWPDKE
ncbi:MAG: AAA family ATPase [Thiolinea sp.]